MTRGKVSASERLSALANVAGALALSGDPDDALRHAVAALPEAMGVDVCLAYEADTEAASLRLRFSQGIPMTRNTN